MPDAPFMFFNRAKLNLMDILMEKEERGELPEEHVPILRKIQHEFIDAVNRRLNN